MISDQEKIRVLHRPQFYLDFEILAFKRLCYSLQYHSTYWMDSARAPKPCAS